MQIYEHPLVALRKRQEEKDIAGLREIDFDKHPLARHNFKNICKSCDHCSSGEHTKVGFVFHCRKYLKLVLEGIVMKKCRGYECVLDYTRFYEQLDIMQ